MKKEIGISMSLVLILCMFYACKKQNEPVALVFQKPYPPKGSDEYYANLRAFKKSDHQLSFGWFTGFGSGPTNNGNTAIMKRRMESLPDSIDIVALFEGFSNIPVVGSPAHETMKNIQKIKGTRFVMTLFGSAVELLMDKNFPGLKKTNVFGAIDSVAKSIVDSVSKFQLDGFDLDYEPNFGDKSIFGTGAKDAGGDVNTQRLFKALSKYLGPMSGTGKLLIIDGENEKGIEPYIDFLAQQAYKSPGPADLETRLQRYGFGTLPSKKFMPCEWLSDVNLNFVDPILGRMPSYYGMAYWQPRSGGRKAGAGLYGPQDNYDDNDPFRVMRNMIQIMNPAIK